MLNPNRMNNPINAQMKNILELRLFVSTNKCPGQDADTDEQEGHQVDTQYRLQSDIDKDAEIQQDEEV